MQDQNALAAQIIPLYQSYARQWDDVRREQNYQQGWLERFMALLPARGAFWVWAVVSDCRSQEC